MVKCRNRRLWLTVAFLLIIYIASAVSLPVLAVDEPVIIALDAGHGGHDGGTDVGIRTEKEYNLIIAKYLAEELSKDERFTVVMTREDDSYLKFLPRAMIAMENDADILISLHCNSSTATYVKGNMAYCSVVDRFDAAALAGKILDSVSAAVPISRGDVEYVVDTGDALGVYYWNDEMQWDMPGAWNLGKKSDYYSINTWASKLGIPSIIVEHGYLSNPDEAAVIDKDENLRKIAKAEADAIIEYYTNHEHTYAEKTVDFPSNCTLTGTASYRCTICGAKYATEALAPDADGHYWRTTASKKATCTEDGYAEYVCQIAYNLNDKGYPCEVHTYTETFTALGHDYIVTEDTAAGHGFDGRLVQQCKNCGDEIVEIRKGELHSYAVAESVAPTCETDGKTVYICSVCSDSYEEKSSATGHSYRETEYVAAGDTEDGYRKFICSDCGKEKTEKEYSCEHIYNKEEIPPTCTTDGKLTEICTLCGYVKETEIPAIGHDYVKQMDEAATCTSVGFYKGKCSVCGDVVTESRPMKEHSFEEEDGVRRCAVCGYEEDVVEAHRTLKDFLSQPVTVAVFALIVVQLGVAVVLIRNHCERKRAEEMRRRKFYDESCDAEESAEMKDNK